MTDEELIARLRKADEYEPLGHDGWEAADRIEALVKERDTALASNRGLVRLNEATEARAEQLAATCERLAALLDRAVNGPWLDGDLERARAALTEAHKDRTDG